MLLFAAGLLFAALPAVAQVGPIIREEPPRPPANIPDGRQVPGTLPPQNNAPLPRREYPSTISRPRQQIPSTTRPSPRSLEARPAPGGLPPTGRRRGSSIESQPLPPPPGATAAPAPPATPQPSETPTTQPGQQQATTTPAEQPALPPSAVVVKPPPQRIDNPTAVFAGLDKITGRITSFDVAIEETVQFGALRVTPRVCYSRPPTESPRTDAFLEVDEVTLQGEIRRIFTGWMFASSPGLHAVEHPIYDIWLTDCKGGTLDVADSEDTGEGANTQPATSTQRR